MKISSLRMQCKKALWSSSCFNVQRQVAARERTILAVARLTTGLTVSSKSTIGKTRSDQMSFVVCCHQDYVQVCKTHSHPTVFCWTEEECLGGKINAS